MGARGKACVRERARCLGVVAAMHRLVLASIAQRKNNCCVCARGCRRLFWKDSCCTANVNTDDVLRRCAARRGAALMICCWRPAEGEMQDASGVCAGVVYRFAGRLSQK